MSSAWPIRNLGEVLEIQNGYAFDSKGFNPTEGMPLIRIRSLKTGTETETRFAGNYDKKYVVNNGDLLIGMDGEFGCYEWKSGAALLNQRVCRLQGFKSDLLPRFLFYGVNSHLKAIEDVTGFATVKHISSKQISGIKFSLPPLQEQQRIVAILDQAFEGIAKARANAEQNLQNARALFESHLQSVFSVRGELVEPQHPSTSSGRADKGWANNNLVALSDLATDITDGDHMPPPKAITGVPFITIGNIVKPTRTIDFTDTFKVPFEYFNKLKANKKPKRGDVLYTVTGSFGIPVLVKDNQEFCFQRHIGLIRPKSDVSSEWLCYLLGSPQLVKQANDGATGTAQKTVSLKVLRGFQVPNLPIDKQNKMVVELDALSKETKRLEAIYHRKIELLDELKKSLLQQAFAGEL